jgi:PAS domain S-box-containing protein
VTRPDEPASDPAAAVLDETADDLYEHAPCGYLSTLPDGTIVKVNQTFLDWIGRSRESLVGRKRFQALLAMGSRMYYETHYAPLLRMQGAVAAIALELMCADRRMLPILVNARERRDADGTPLFNRITVFDATDRRRYERELLLARRKAEQVAKDKSDLISMLSHDIRNPLNALMGVVQMLDESGLTDAQHRLVRILKSSSESMLALLTRVLDMSRAESASFTLVEKPLSIRDVVAGVVATFDAKARDKGLRLGSVIGDEVPCEVLGDPVAMRQILTNLTDNALKFTVTGSVEIRVQASAPAADAVTLDIAVADTGIGIAPEAVERIFNEFTQASYETKLKFGGSGLGLSIARKLLSLYGSSIHLDSAPGQGSTFSFRVRLPIPRASDAHAPD